VTKRQFGGQQWADVGEQSAGLRISWINCSTASPRVISVSNFKISYNSLHVSIHYGCYNQTITCCETESMPSYTVMCIPIARQRLGKHIPAGANARDNRECIARQRCGKHDSSKIQAVFCVIRVDGL
jgi:hypothetical protein